MTSIIINPAASTRHATVIETVSSNTIWPRARSWKDINANIDGLFFQAPQIRGVKLFFPASTTRRAPMARFEQTENKKTAGSTPRRITARASSGGGMEGCEEDAHGFGLTLDGLRRDFSERPDVPTFT
ncbi:MAG TPA: hypothetical protein VMJ12_05250 [Candidatus Acidoferrales bacterium]|nr:hypothetical protein [Candidatus Acidoferrales bacterium]